MVLKKVYLCLYKQTFNLKQYTQCSGKDLIKIHIISTILQKIITLGESEKNFTITQ